MMIVYSIMLFLGAILFLALGISVYRGNVKLIIDYHKRNVKESERQDYGRAFAKGMFAICATLLISGMIVLLGKVAASYIVLAVGFIVSIVLLVTVQKKYNGGLF